MPIDHANALLGAFYGSVSSVGGVIIAYVWNHNRNLKKQRDELIKSLEFNHQRADQISRQLASGITPNYKFDTGGLVIWLSRSTDIIPPKIRDEISWHRYQMDHANTILETYYVFVRLWNGGIEKAHIQKQDINEIIERLRTIQENTSRHIEELRRL